MHRVFAVAALAAGSVAHADVYFEITVSGESPDGMTGTVALLTPGAFDVYVWGTGDDTTLLLADYAVAAEERFGWLMMDLGESDPEGLFDERSDGHFGFFPDGLLGIIVRSHAGVALPRTPGTALKIYEGYMARPDAPGALMNVYPAFVTTNTGDAPTVRTIGIVEAPAPGAAMALGGAVLGACGRRRC